MNSRLVFRTAGFSDFPGLMSIWRDCFMDSPEATAHIFTHLQKPGNIFILADEKGPVSMLCVHDFMFASPFGSYKSVYIYGVATAPAERGKGYCGVLMKNMDYILANKNCACATLVPSEESLFGFYEKFGYEKAFNINKAEFTAAETSKGPSYPFERIDSASLFQLRNASFADSKMFACWDTEYLDYIIKESEFYGGGAYAAEIENNRVCAVCYKNGGTVLIKELCAPRHALESTFRSIAAHFGADKYEIYLREDTMTPYTNKILPFAMIKWYDNEVNAEMKTQTGAPAYITHVLD